MAPPFDALDDGIRDLYRGALGEFTPRRQALAKRLIKAGHPRAGEVKALCKPTPSAWAVNRLFAVQASALATLIDAGVRAREAGSRGDGATVRAALELIRDQASGLSALAVEQLAAAQGAAVSAAVEERVRTDLDALALDPGHAALIARGWLDLDLEPPGFEVMAGLQLAAEQGRSGAPTGAAGAKAGKAKAAPTAQGASAGAEERRARERQERIAGATDELRRVEARAEELRLALEAANETAAVAGREAVAAQERAEQARRAATEARLRAETAKAEIPRAREAVRRAEGS